MADGLALASRLVLAAVFAVAAVTKLRDRAALARALAPFGVPRGLAGLVPSAEVVIAVMLVVGRGVLAPVAALGMLGLFTAAVIVALRRGTAVPCPCFGRSAAPVSARAIARNGWLGALGVIATGSTAHPRALTVAITVFVLGVVSAWFVREPAGTPGSDE
jgi:uncharacterized membrane protein YphA (DoxX/SURF4 family)